MSKRFFHHFNTLVLLALTLGLVHLASSVGFSQDTYTVPQTAEVTLAWDPNDPAPDGYRIYQRTDGQSYDYDQPSWTGSGVSGIVYNLDWDTTYHFVVRAYAGTLESADSQEVSFVAPSPAPATYSISTTAGDHGAISPSGTVVVPEDSNQSFTIIPDTGFHVADVKVDGQSMGPMASYTFSQIIANHTIDVSFAVDTYVITAASGANGTITPVGDTGVDHGSSQTFLFTPDAGYSVANVIVDGVAKGAMPSYTFETVTNSHTISANFAVDTHQITASAGANGSISSSGTVNVEDGSSKSYTIIPATGHHIADVLVDGVSMGAVNTYTFIQIEANHSIHATFAADTFAITATAAADGTIIPAGSVEVTYGANQTFTFVADSGFRIADVQVDGQSMGAIGSHTISNVTNDHTISVSFSEIEVVKIQIEAEDGDLFWPMAIGDDASAASGSYVWVPTGSGDILDPSENAGYAEYHFEVPETGDYVIWGRQISNDTASDSFFVSMDGQADMVWHTILGGQDLWTWDVVSNRAVDDLRDTTHPQQYRLEVGSHTLTIRQREAGTRLDTIIITNDLSLEVSDLDSAFQAPVIEVNAYDPCIPELGNVAISLNATDPGKGNLTYTWELPDGGSISGSGNRVVFAPESVGPHPCPYRVNVVVSSDASHLSSTYVFYIYVKLRSDLNGDGYVNFTDFIKFRDAYGKTGSPGWVLADMNRDGTVNLIDFSILSSQYGQNGCAYP